MDLLPHREAFVAFWRKEKAKDKWPTKCPGIWTRLGLQLSIILIISTSVKIRFSSAPDWLNFPRLKSVADRNQSKTVGTSTITYNVFLYFVRTQAMKEMTFALSLNGLIYTSRMRLVVLSIVNAAQLWSTHFAP